MSSASSPPLVQGRNIRPKARDTTLEFWWDYPASDGGATISSYTLSCADPSISQSVGPSTFYNKISSLTNGTEYTFQIVANDDTSASSAPAVYRTITPGFKASVALSTSAVATGSGKVAVSWQPPASDGNSPIGWYVVRSVSSSPSDPIIKVSAYSTDSNKTISGLNTGSMYSFNVYAVNGPGYSLPASTLTISPNLGDIFTYIEVYEPDGGSNYAYRIYNSYSDEWNVINSLYTVNDSDGDYSSSNFSNYNDNGYYDYEYAGGTSNIFYNTYRSRYYYPGTSYYEYKFEFRNTDGSLLRTISTIDNYENFYLPHTYGNHNTAFFYNSNDSNANYDIQIYQPHTNTYQSDSLTFDGYIEDYNALNNGVYFVTWDADHYNHYIWNINSNTPTLITSNYDYNNYINIFGVSTAIFIVSRTNDPSYYDTVTYMDDTGFSSNYSLESNTYTNINDIEQYGLLGNRAFFIGYNLITSNYDVYAFNQMPDMTPVILSNIYSNGYSYNYWYEYNYTGGESYNQTYDASDVLLIVNTEKTNYYIGSGSRLDYGFLNIFNGGNNIDIQITLEDSSIPINQSYMYYGTSYQTSNFGYLVGSKDAYPHTSLTYTTAGSNDIYVHGQYQVLNGNNGLFSTFSGSYTCTNGNYGTYWVRQTGSALPTVDVAPFGVDLWYSVENSNWGSVRTSDGISYQNSPYYQYDYRTIVSGSNLIFCKSLIGSISSIGGEWRGTFLDDTTIVGFLESYVNDAPFCDDPNDFSTINVRAFDEWNLSTGHVYYSSLTTNFPYIYDGNTENPSQGKGTGYLIIGSNTTVVSTIFTGSNLLLNNWTTINSNGAGFLEQEQNIIKSHILTASGETSTILSTAAVFSPNYTTNNTNEESFSDLFYYNIDSSNNFSSFLFVVSNEGDLLTSNIVGSNDNVYTRFSGRNALRYEYYTSNLHIIQNGVLTSTINMPYGEEDMEEPYPDFANGQLAITSYDNDSNTIIVTVTNDAISTFSTSLFTDNTNSFLTQSFLMMWHDYPFTLLARDVNAGIDYGFSTIGDLYEDYYYNQADSIGFKVIDDNNGARNYVVFNFSTTTFSMLSTSSAENEEYTFTTSPYWYD